MLVSDMELELSDDHEGIIDLPDDAPRRAALRGLCRARRPGDRDQPDAEPARLHLGARHRPRSRGGGPRQAEGRRRAAGARRRRLPGRRHARLRARRRASLPGLRAAPRARREERRRRRRGCSGGSPPSACARSTRSSTSPTTSPTTAAGRCTSSTPRRSRAISPSAARATARRSSPSTGAPTGSTIRIVVIADEDGVEVDRRHHGRRALGLRRDDHRRADRIGAVGPAQHRADRPPARHQSPTRATASSAASIRPSACPASTSRPAWCSTSAAAKPCERRRRGRDPRHRPHHRLPLDARCERLSGLDVPRPEIEGHPREPRLPRRGRRRPRQGAAAVLAARRRGQGRPRRGGDPHRRARPHRAAAAAARRGGGGAPDPHADPEAHAAREARFSRRGASSRP